MVCKALLILLINTTLLLSSSSAREHVELQVQISNDYEAAAIVQHCNDATHIHDNPREPTDLDCNGHPFTVAQQLAAVQEAQSTKRYQCFNTHNAYPKAYTNKAMASPYGLHILNTNGNAYGPDELCEYPILADHKVWGPGDEPGPYRVVFKPVKDKLWRYHGLVYHAVKGKSDFNCCYVRFSEKGKP